MVTIIIAIIIIISRPCIDDYYSNTKPIKPSLS
jgi:hypothetical protein